MAEIPRLVTERLLLREFRDSDIDEYAAICADPDVMRYLTGAPLSRSDAWRQMAMFVGHWQLKGFGLWAVEERATGALIGRIGCLRPEGWPDFEIGWTLGKRWWGKGFATEGARVAMDYAFDVVGRDHVISLIQPDNRASIRVAERLGETHESETVLFDKRVLIYGISKSTWKAGAAT